MDKITFVAMLFVGSLVSLLSGGMALYEHLQFRFDGRQAQMELAVPSTRKSRLPTGGFDVIPQDVKYRGTDGEVFVPQKRLGGDIAQRLIDGEKIPVTYLKHNPQRVMYAGDELPNPWGWLIVGAVLLPMSLMAYRMLRREGIA
ncbi:hypothetical protein D0B54_06705 [Solimonas sp. K1W22B-7]|uniref:hypothetical protein n=1 Tax=Solimonas sp. K1W22B-7 TaxID=2303331 RepID=UPI000E331E0D|nr:hypothetical protein [Solimonas sp. K1W22B-7]AXQ28390.1 hypothetical protein D0B54_06705 [Solimonas sp. K1W22B-7]